MLTTTRGPASTWPGGGRRPRTAVRGDGPVEENIGPAAPGLERWSPEPGIGVPGGRISWRSAAGTEGRGRGVVVPGVVATEGSSLVPPGSVRGWGPAARSDGVAGPRVSRAAATG